MATRSLNAALLALLALAFSGAAAAQQQERPRDPRDPRADTTARDTLPRDTVVAAQPSLGYQPPTISAALMIGLPGSTDAQEHPIRIWQTDPTGAVLDSAVLSRTVEIRGGVYAGLSGALGLGRDWAVRVGIGVATGTLQASYTGSDESFVESANTATGNTADLEIVTLESALQYRIPSTRQVQPYLELGAAISRWSADGPVPEAAALSGATRYEVMAGLGGIIPVTRRLSARLHASRRVFRTPVPLAAAGDTVLTSSPLVGVSRPAGSTSFADAARETLDMLRLQAGISYDLGRPPPTPDAVVQPPAEAAPDTTSQSRR